ASGRTGRKSRFVDYRDLDHGFILGLADDLDVDVPAALFQLDQRRVDRLIDRAAPPFSRAHRNSPLALISADYLLGLLGLEPFFGPFVGPFFGPLPGPFFGGGGVPPFASDPPATVRLNRAGSTFPQPT